MSPIKQFTMALACVLSLTAAVAQNRTVTGVVSATSGESVIGAGVLIDGTSKGGFIVALSNDYDFCTKKLVFYPYI